MLREFKEERTKDKSGEKCSWIYLLKMFNVNKKEYIKVERKWQALLMKTKFYFVCKMTKRLNRVRWYALNQKILNLRIILV